MKHKPSLNQAWIDPQALNIVRSLQKNEHTTYLVGGCVRDLLLGLPPKDFDIATSARPREVSRIIRPSFVIGKRFRLVLVKRHGKQFEVSTFRANSSNSDDIDAPVTDDNTFGSPEEDAHRRDFTINSLFYDPVEKDLIDYTDGLADIQKRVLRMIGDPYVRIQEDPIRMLRALRFAHRAGFKMETTLRQAIKEMADKLQQSVLPRRREEFLKILQLKRALPALWEAKDLNLLQNLTPTLTDQLSHSHFGDLFFENLRRGLRYRSEPNNSHELIGLFLFSYLSAIDKEFCSHLKVKDKKRTELEPFLRDELGIHRVEQESFYQALSLLKQLQQLKNPETIRERHREHLVRNNSLSLTLSLAGAFQLLSGPDLYYWLDEYWKTQNRS